MNGEDLEDEESFELQLILWALALIIDNQETLMATAQEVSAQVDTLSGLIDQLTTQEAGESSLAPGQVAVSQADLDALAQKVSDATTHAQGLIDAAPPAPAPAPVAGPPAGTGVTTPPTAPPAGP